MVHEEARDVMQSIAETAKHMVHQLGEDPEYSNMHRLASEQIIASTQGSEDVERITKRLNLAENYGKQALGMAKNSRQRMLSMGLIMTANAIRVLVETGLETVPVESSNT